MICGFIAILGFIVSEMKVEEIVAIAKNGSGEFYRWLGQQPGGGEQQVQVRRINRVGNSREVFKLILDRRLHGLEFIQFKYLSNGPIGEKYDAKHIKIEEYDADSHSLIVIPDADRRLLFERGNPQDWLVISDMKFLVRRVQEWYEVRGGSIKFPTAPPKLIPEWRDSIAGSPSPEQMSALEVVLGSPVSYIWGAPGTGKTRYVLANAILCYLKAGKKVGVFAPTNLALEQVLRGVIEMLDIAEIPRDRILRLGIPTHDFASTFPEVCEVRGISTRIQNIEKQIKTKVRILANQIAQQKQRQLRKALEFEIEFAQNLARVEAEGEELQVLIAEEKRAMKTLEVLVNEQKVIVEHLAKMEQQLAGIWHRVSKWWVGKSRKTSLELSFEDRIAAKAALDERIKIQVGVSQKQKGEVELQRQNLDQADRTNELVTQVRQVILGDSEAERILDSFSSGNFKSIFSRLAELFSAREKDQMISDSLALEYDDEQRLALMEQIRVLEVNLDQLRKFETETRIKDAPIVAATLDTFVHRFLEDELDVDHIFLDEAAYSSVVKTMTLFRRGIPVTMLGDHMQLPPVCEMSLNEMRKEPRFQDIFLWAQSGISIEDLFSYSKVDAMVSYAKQSDPCFNTIKKYDLKRTFRFGPQLAEVLDARVYRNGFGSESKSGDTEIYYLDAPLKRPRFGNGNWGNIDEAELIQEFVLRNFIPSDKLAILAPYNTQVEKLVELLPKFHLNDQILTVHRSQGREWETLILSVADTDNMFLMNSNNREGIKLLNTAVSRAKRKLILVCDRQFWIGRNGQLVKELLEVARPI